MPLPYKHLTIPVHLLLFDGVKLQNCMLDELWHFAPEWVDNRLSVYEDTLQDMHAYMHNLEIVYGMDGTICLK